MLFSIKNWSVRYLAYWLFLILSAKFSIYTNWRFLNKPTLIAYDKAHKVSSFCLKIIIVSFVVQLFLHAFGYTCWLRGKPICAADIYYLNFHTLFSSISIQVFQHFQIESGDALIYQSRFTVNVPRFNIRFNIGFQ